MITVSLEAIAARFQQFSVDSTVVQGSPLYAHLSAQIVQHPDVMALVSQHQAGQPEPNLLFGAVHRLLLGGVQHPLRAYYDGTASVEDSLPVFVDFCLKHADEIRAIVQVRLVQTNEVGRSALLLPAWYWITQHSGQPLALIELGASAGLNLYADRYHVQYIHGTDYHPKEPSGVHLTCEVKGATLPDMSSPLNIQSRVGLDLNPLDVTEHEEEFWLKALIWPQQHQRIQRFQGAVAIMKQHPIPLLAGNALELLPKLLQAIPQGVALCVFHTFVLYQFTSEMKSALENMLREHSKQRPIYEIGMGNDWQADYELYLRHYTHGDMTHQRLALINAHGRFIEWL
jgi:hypothetical protein